MYLFMNQFQHNHGNQPISACQVGSKPTFPAIACKVPQSQKRENLTHAYQWMLSKLNLEGSRRSIM